jgi:hypothetical protein
MHPTATDPGLDNQASKPRLLILTCLVGVIVLGVASGSALVWVGHKQAETEREALTKERNFLLMERSALHKERAAFEKERAAFHQQRESRAQHQRAIQEVIDEDCRAQAASFGFWTNYVVPAPARAGGPPSRPPAALARPIDAPPRVKLADYVERLRKVDFSACPEEFKLAYLRHIQAWDRKLDFAHRSNSNHDLMAALISLACFAHGLPPLGKAAAHGLLNESGSVAKRSGTVEDEIRESWYEVEQAAWKYDVRVPRRGR